MSDLINPCSIVVPQVDPDALESAASDIRKQGGNIAGAGQDIKSAWSELESCYSAPEAETLHSAVDPVVDKGDEVEGDLDTVATALETFAETARELKVKLDVAKQDAQNFVDSVQDDSSWAVQDTLGLPTEKVQEHDALLDRVATWSHQYQEAERECANTITGLFKHGTTFIGADGSGAEPGNNEQLYGTERPITDMTDGETPWGSPQGSDAWPFTGFAVGRKEVEFGFEEDMLYMSGFLGEHGRADSLPTWGRNITSYWADTAAQTGAMVGAWNPETGTWAHGLDERWAVASTSWRNAAHEVVPWTEFEQRPGYVAGVAFENFKYIGAGIALSFVPGGQLAGAALTGTRVVRILGGLGRSDGQFDIDAGDAGSGGERRPRWQRQRRRYSGIARARIRAGIAAAVGHRPGRARRPLRHRRYERGAGQPGRRAAARDTAVDTAAGLRTGPGTGSGSALRPA